MSIVGIHISNITDTLSIINSNKHYKNIELIQIFVNGLTDYTDQKYKDILKYIKKNKIKIVVHGSYSINLAKLWKENDWWIQQFIQEIHACNELDAFGIVIHTGKKLDLSNSEAINNMYTSFITKQNLIIILEY